MVKNKQQISAIDKTIHLITMNLNLSSNLYICNVISCLKATSKIDTFEAHETKMFLEENRPTESNPIVDLPDNVKITPKESAFWSYYFKPEDSYHWKDFYNLNNRAYKEQVRDMKLAYLKKLVQILH